MYVLGTHWHIQPLPGTAHIDGHPHVDHAAANCSEDDISIATRQNFKELGINSHGTLKRNVATNNYIKW
jgi:hypothetical protein